MTAKCKKCRKIKPEFEFAVSAFGTLKETCMACSLTVKNRKKPRKNVNWDTPEARKAYMRKYFQEHKEERTAYCRKRLEVVKSDPIKRDELKRRHAEWKREYRKKKKMDMSQID